ncbi:MAG: hypothetical protein IK990_21090 [Ruminiclostridium sp.]|nr:hypothetical protein [Ruminiclostridium sp.]
MGLTREEIRKFCRTNEPEGWRATEKPEIHAERMGRKVGGQQKNQSLKGIARTAVLAFPFKFSFSVLKLLYERIVVIMKASFEYCKFLLAQLKEKLDGYTIIDIPEPDYEETIDLLEETIDELSVLHSTESECSKVKDEDPADKDYLSFADEKDERQIFHMEKKNRQLNFDNQMLKKENDDLIKQYNASLESYNEFLRKDNIRLKKDNKHLVEESRKLRKYLHELERKMNKDE